MYLYRLACGCSLLMLYKISQVVIPLIPTDFPQPACDLLPEPLPQLIGVPGYNYSTPYYNNANVTHLSQGQVDLF